MTIPRITPAATNAAGDAKRTARFIALPLVASTPTQRHHDKAVRVKMDIASSQGAVWLRMKNGEPASKTEKSAGNTRKLPAVLLDTRSEKRSITARQIDITLPANSLVNMALWRSSERVQ